MKKNSILRFFIVLAFVPWTVIAEPNIPKSVKAKLKDVYKDPNFQEVRGTFPLAKMIHVLSNNDEHWKSLENVLDDDELKLFIEMVDFIILVETQKENVEYWKNIWDNVAKFGIAAGAIIGSGLGAAAFNSGLKMLPNDFLSKQLTNFLSPSTQSITGISKSICPHVVRNTMASSGEFDVKHLLFSSICNF